MLRSQEILTPEHEEIVKFVSESKFFIIIIIYFLGQFGHRRRKLIIYNLVGRNK